MNEGTDRQAKRCFSGIAGKFAVQPSLGVSPVSFRMPQRDAKRFGRFRHRQSGEVTQLDYISSEWIGLLQPGEGLVQVHQIAVGRVDHAQSHFEIDAATLTAVLESFPAARFLD
jgi:hypothetical protein